MRDEAISKKRRQLILGGLSSLAIPTRASWAAADSYPTRPITFICPWPAGGSSDVTMRALVSIVSPLLGQPMPVENRAGASGMLGTKALASAKPDGYTIGQVPLSVTRFAQLGTVSIDPLKDITYIARTTGQTFGIAAQTDSRFKSIAELVAYAKSNPGKVTYATAGIAGQTHVGMEEFALAAGIEMSHIPYKGGADALLGLLGGHVDLLADSTSWVPHVLQGKLRLLATWNEQRLPRFAEAPTLKELGYNVVMNAPNGVGAPRGLDPQITVKLREAFRKAILSDEFRKECEKLDVVVMYQDADDYRKFIEESYAHEKKLIERLKLKEKMA
jgi:tripartite-type tricarboxylate transporter receptor subunit TctC